MRPASTAACTKTLVLPEPQGMTTMPGRLVARMAARAWAWTAEESLSLDPGRRENGAIARRPRFSEDGARSAQARRASSGPRLGRGRRRRRPRRRPRRRRPPPHAQLGRRPRARVAGVTLQLLQHLGVVRAPGRAAGAVLQVERGRGQPVLFGHGAADLAHRGPGQQLERVAAARERADADGDAALHFSCAVLNTRYHTLRKYRARARAQQRRTSCTPLAVRQMGHFRSVFAAQPWQTQRWPHLL